MEQVESVLRGGAASGAPIPAMLDVWSALEAFASRREETLFDILQAGDETAAHAGAAAELTPEQVGVALVTRLGRVVRADTRFRQWIGDALREPALMRLVRQAQGGAPALGLVSAGAEAAFPVLAAKVSPGSKWREVVERLAGGSADGEVLLIAFAPSRSKPLIVQAARSIGLSAVEAELAATLMEEPSVESAAYRLGLAVETAREAMRRAMRRTGARNAAQLIGRIVDLGAGQAHRPFNEPSGADALLGLTPSELRLARLLGDGLSAEKASASLGLSVETAKSYRQSIFAKLGINRTRTLRRVMTETRALQALNEAGEVSWSPPAGGALRIIVDADGRSVACIDYGPAAGRPLLLFHGSTTGRLAAPPMLAALHARGFRPIVPQRPGFGMTSPARRSFAESAADDLALIIERLGLGPVTLISRDGGVAAAMAFATRHARLLAPGSLMLNPRRPRGAVRSAASPMNAITSLLLKHPRLVEPFARMLARQTREDLLRRMLTGVFDAVEADRACAAQPEVMRHLIADLRGLVGRGAEGFAAEHQVFAEGWRPPPAFDPSPWTFVFSGALWPAGDLEVWRRLALGSPQIIAGAGQLVQFTHAEPLAALLPARTVERGARRGAQPTSSA